MHSRGRAYDLLLVRRKHPCDVSWATIQRFEATDDIPESRSGTLERVVAALEAEGIELIGDPLKSPGVRLKRMGR